MSEELWYYSQGGEKQGPVSFSHLQEMAAAVTLRPDDLLWRAGMESWSPARSVHGLLAVAQPPSLDRVASSSLGSEGNRYLAQGKTLLERTRGLDDADVASQRIPHVRLIGRLLELLEATVSDTLLDRIDRGARTVGHIAYAAAALLYVVFYAAMAIKADSMQLFFVALLGILPLALVGHYTAVMFLEAGARLISGQPSRVFSRAFLNCTGLIFSFSALVPLFGGFYLLIKTSDFGSFGASLALSAVLFYLGAVSLSPVSLNIEIAEDAGAGEEALGILSFLIKMFLRLVPVVFGVGTVAGAGAAIYFLVLLFKGEIFSLDFPVVSDLSVLDVTVGVLGLGIFPLIAYLAFVTFHLVLDLLRSVLDVPCKLEALQQVASKE